MGQEQTKILIIEDDISIQKNLERLLKMKGYSILCANNGSEGLVKLNESSDIKLVLLDLMMPVMDGHEFMASLDPNFNIPIIVLTAGRDEVQSELVSSVVRKPFQLAALLSKVNELLVRG